MLRRDLNWYGLSSTGWPLLYAAAVVAAVVLIVVLLRYERKLVTKRVGHVLVALRILTVGLLFLTFLEPVLTWTLDREQTGRVLVAVDLSESMSTTDKHAKKAEKLRWARALGLIGNPGINDRLDRWLDAFEENREPPWVDKTETGDPQQRKQLAEIRKQNLDNVFAEIDRLSRKEIARRLLVGTASPLLAKLQDIANVELTVFAGRSESADETTLETLLARPPERVLTGVSDLTRALTPASPLSGPLQGDAERDGRSQASPIIGVVLFTDGRDNAGRDSVGMAARLGQTAVPVFPVLLGSELQPKDLAIASLEYPRTVFKDDRPVLKVTLRTAGFENEPLEVVLETEGRDPITKTVIPEGNTASVEFQLDSADIGRHEYTVRTDVRPGETRDDNNAKVFALNVVDDTVRVLLIEGEARWEFRFIDNALRRDERVDVKRVVYRQPYLGVLNENFFPRTLQLPDAADDLENSPFAEPDLVILGDIAPQELPRRGWELLEKFVTDSGGTLVFVAGKQHFPLSYNLPIVDRLLPVTKLRPLNVPEAAALGSPTQRGFRLQLTPEGELEPLFQFDTDNAENRSIWQGLPGHLWGLVGEAKPGATVLAHAIAPADDATLAKQRENAIVVHQHYGFGQVLWIGIDSTWRWRHRVGDTYHHRFWGQLGRFAAENKATAGNEFVKFGPEESDIEAGDDVMVRARWTRQFLQKFPNLKARAKVVRLFPASKGGNGKKRKPFATIELSPVEARPLIHEARLVSLPAGEYRVQLKVEQADLGSDEIEATLFVNEKQTPELSNLSSNRKLLTQLADVSHGRLLLPDELHKLPGLLSQPNFTTTVRREVELWDHWLVLLVFFTLLTAEWVVRKLNGLP